MKRGLTGVLIGAGAAVAVTLGLTLGLGIVLPIAGVIGAGVGIGAGLVTAPGAARKLEKLQIEPTTTEGLLEASVSRADEMAKQLSRLTSRALWANSRVDERIGDMLGGIRTLAGTPALRARDRADGDVQTLYLLATDYLPTLVNLAIENDRMHASFRGAGSRDEVVRNVAALDEQAGILGEVLERIETDVVQGVSRDAAQHAAFLASRFERIRTPAILDISQPPASTPPSLPASQNGASA